MKMEEIKKFIRDVPDFPKPGILFKDITPLLQSPEAFQKVIGLFIERYQGKPIDRVVGIESRGFIFGSVLAHALKKGFSLVRKTGKLPWKKVSMTYDLEYGTDTIQMHEDAVHPRDRVLVVDDLLATGGTAQAACELIRKMGGQVVECAFVVELEFLKGREKLKDVEVFSLLKY
jgi:adenine phosphoribosyltransferase